MPRRETLGDFQRVMKTQIDEAEAVTTAALEDSNGTVDTRKAAFMQYAATIRKLVNEYLGLPNA